jgi:hypothetical protein
MGYEDSEYAGFRCRDRVNFDAYRCRDRVYVDADRCRYGADACGGGHSLPLLAPLPITLFFKDILFLTSASFPSALTYPF